MQGRESPTVVVMSMEIPFGLSSTLEIHLNDSPQFRLNVNGLC